MGIDEILLAIINCTDYVAYLELEAFLLHGQSNADIATANEAFDNLTQEVEAHVAELETAFNATCEAERSYHEGHLPPDVEERLSFYEAEEAGYGHLYEKVR